MAWVWFLIVQILMLIATVLGWVILLPFCLSKAWKDYEPHPVNGRVIDFWSFKALNWVYGNPEDGVSGKRALIWNDQGEHIPYMPDAPDWWRAYCWSAWRNSCDNLKYVFAWQDGPLFEKTITIKLPFKTFTLNLKCGWQEEENGFKVPVL